MCGFEQALPCGFVWALMVLVMPCCLAHLNTIVSEERFFNVGLNIYIPVGLPKIY